MITLVDSRKMAYNTIIQIVNQPPQQVPEEIEDQG